MNNFGLNFKRLVFLLLGATVALTCEVSADSYDEVHDKERIVSAGGSVTEILFALELGPQVVAIDTSSLYPVEATTRPKIGYYRQLSPEGVLAQQPDVLVGHSQMGPEDVLTQISRTGVEVLNVKHDYSIESLSALITSLAKRFNREETGSLLIKRIKDQLASVRADVVSQHTNANNAKDTDSVDKGTLAFFASVGSRGLVAAGSNSMPATLFSLAGYDNAFSDFQGYHPISPEALLAAAPSQIFIPAHAAAGQSTEVLCKLPALRMWASLKGCNVTVVDPLVFMGLSPRLPEGVALISNLHKS